VPLELLFSGTVFHTGPGGALQTAQLSWEQEAAHDLPAAHWHAAMERFYGDRRWLRLEQGTFERLAAYRTRRALPSWEAAVDELLARGEPA
jgi:predicted alpha-1,6-mannanase (GH76 family)